MSLRIGLVNFSHSGGMSHYFQNLAEALADHADIYAIVNERDAAAVGPWRSRTFASPTTRGIRAAAQRSLSGWTNGRAACVDGMVDVLHIVSEGFELLPFMAAARTSRVPTVLTIHDPIPHNVNRSKRAAAIDAANEALLAPLRFTLASALHVHSERHRQYLIDGKGLDPRKIYVVQHGVGVAMSLRPAHPIQQPPPAESGSIRVLMFGRLEPYKGLDVLVDAVERLGSDGTVHLTIAGNGTVPSTIMQRLALLPRPALVINRYISEAKVAHLFSASDVVVLPYRDATQSGVAALALAFGKPVIASDVGAIGEMVRDQITGHLVKPGDPVQLAEALRRVASRRERQKLARNAHDYGEELSWRSIAGRHVRAYGRLIERSRTSLAAVPELGESK